MGKFGQSLFSVLLIFGLLFSCSKEEKIVNDEIILISYGTYFNMCIGYCQRDIIFENKNIVFHRAGISDSIDIVTCYDILEDNKWEELISQINVDQFIKLPETIGCPDCSDGGVEWIEIELTDGNKHKVSFEMGDEPSETKNYIEFLRVQLAKYEFCDEE